MGYQPNTVGKAQLGKRQSMSSEAEVTGHITTLTRRNLTSKVQLVIYILQTDPSF